MRHRDRLAVGVLAVVAAACSSSAASAPGASLTTVPATVAAPPSTSPERTASAASTVSTVPTTTDGGAAAARTPPTAPSIAPSIAPATMPATAPDTTGPSGPITLAFVGDVLPHSPLWRRAERNAAEAGREGYDFTPMLAGLAPVVAGADLAVCHLETPIAPAGEELSTMPRYGVPAEIADALAAAGFDRCSTASNHTLDRGTAGVDRTVDVLESRGLGQSGVAREPYEILPVVFEVGGLRISHLSYTWSYNGLQPPEDEPWRSALIDVDRIVLDATAARNLGADLVVVSLHWGAEGVHEPTYSQRDVAERLTAAGVVDLVVGHHAHVVQPIERINGTWVAFGLGNILSNLPTSSRWPDATQDGAVLTVQVDRTREGAVHVGRPRVHPTWVDRDAGWQVRLVAPALADADLDDGRRRVLERSWDRTAAVLGDFVVGRTTAEQPTPTTSP